MCLDQGCLVPLFGAGKTCSGQEWGWWSLGQVGGIFHPNELVLTLMR